VKIVEALSQMTMCVVEKVEKQPVLTMWDKVKLWSPEMHHNVLHSVTAGFEVSTHGGEAGEKGSSTVRSTAEFVEANDVEAVTRREARRLGTQ
jgi:hypothetical protein